MAKPIAELLVETMATLTAAPDGTGDTIWTDDGVRLNALRIVAAVYGPPCEAPVFRVPQRLPIPAPAEWAPMSEDVLPFAECERCRWPRSFHP